jgi:hypothetical protein
MAREKERERRRRRWRRKRRSGGGRSEKGGNVLKKDGRFGEGIIIPLSDFRLLYGLEDLWKLNSMRQCVQTSRVVISSVPIINAHCQPKPYKCHRTMYSPLRSNNAACEAD